MKVLNLYAGIGGNRKYWENCEVTAIEYDPKTAAIYQDHFPNDTLIVADAHQYLLDHYKEFNFIWSSPPCPTHSRARFAYSSNYKTNLNAVYPDMKLYQEIIFLDKYFKGKYCVENVIPFYEPLIPPTKKIGKHIFWANFSIKNFSSIIEKKSISIQTKDTINGFNIFNLDIENKVQTLRNMVNADLGLHIFQNAKNIFVEQKVEQTFLF